MKVPDFRTGKFNEHYEVEYSPAMMQWRYLGAIDKSRNILNLMSGYNKKISSVLEVGCGTGIVIDLLRKSGLGKRHVGIDIIDPSKHSDSRIEHAGIELVQQTSARLPFDDGSFDLVIATHVLEHVEDERGFLRELSRVSKKFIYIEVPCEVNIRSSIVSMQKALDIGHINVYTPESFALTLATSGLDTVTMAVFDHSRDVQKFSSSPLKSEIRIWLRRFAKAVNQRWATRFLTYHCGALCRVRSNE